MRVFSSAECPTRRGWLLLAGPACMGLRRLAGRMPGRIRRMHANTSRHLLLLI
jgi:hypothetical protein